MNSKKMPWEETQAKNLTASEICSIIKECARQNVAEMTFGELHVKFQPLGERIEVPGPSANHLRVRVPAKTLEKIETEAVKQGELAVKEDDLAQMLIDDPAQYEKLLLQGDLTDDADDGRGA